MICRSASFSLDVSCSCFRCVVLSNLFATVFASSHCLWFFLPFSLRLLLSYLIPFVLAPCFSFFFLFPGPFSCSLVLSRSVSVCLSLLFLGLSRSFSIRLARSLSLCLVLKTILFRVVSFVLVLSRTFSLCLALSHYVSMLLFWVSSVLYCCTLFFLVLSCPCSVCLPLCIALSRFVCRSFSFGIPLSRVLLFSFVSFLVGVSRSFLLCVLLLFVSFFHALPHFSMSASFFIYLSCSRFRCVVISNLITSVFPSSHCLWFFLSGFASFFLI